LTPLLLIYLLSPLSLILQVDQQGDDLSQPILLSTPATPLEVTLPSPAFVIATSPVLINVYRKASPTWKSVRF